MSEEISVVVKGAGASVTVLIDANDHVAALKAKVAEQAGVPATEQRLCC